jgi:hypothetical protein
MKLTRAQELALINYAINHIITNFLTDEGEEVDRNPTAKRAAALIAKGKNQQEKKKGKGTTGKKWSAEQRRKFMAHVERRRAQIYARKSVSEASTANDTTN